MSTTTATTVATISKQIAKANRMIPGLPGMVKSFALNIGADTLTFAGQVLETIA